MAADAATPSLELSEGSRQHSLRTPSSPGLPIIAGRHQIVLEIEDVNMVWLVKPKAGIPKSLTFPAGFERRR
jgi:hypothetical protein